MSNDLKSQLYGVVAGLLCRLEKDDPPSFAVRDIAVAIGVLLDKADRQ